MDLPGLSFEPAAAPTSDEKPTTTYDLTTGAEWRFEVPYGSSIEVKLIRGTAELFGTELAPNQPYTFSGTKAAIHTWAPSATLTVTGSPSSDYVAEETPMASYANLHFALEARRAASSSGPRVMLVGPDDSGKSALAKLLAAYATRSQRRPLVVNLDPSEGLLTVPGTLTAVAFESILDVEEGWGSSPLTGPSPVPVKLPLVYFYGAADPAAAPERYKRLLTRLALAVRHHLDDDAAARQTGLVVDTGGSMAGAAAARDQYGLIRAAVTELRIDVLVVLGSERLFSGLSKHFPPSANGAAPSDVTLLRLDKSGGCVERDATFRDQTRAAQVRAYFFGRQLPPAPSLAPHTVMLPFADVAIYKPADPADVVPEGLMPGGLEDALPTVAKQRPGLLERVTPPFSPDMQGALLAVLQVDAGAGMDAVLEASTLGFLAVAEVDSDKARLKVLSPMGGRVPRNALFWGTELEVGADFS